MADAVKSKPDEFDVIRFVNQNVLDAAIERVSKYADKVRIGSLSQKEATIIAQDTESSILEMLFTGIFEAKTEDFLRLMKDITEETREHKSYFDKKLKELNAKAAADAMPVPSGGQKGDEEK